MSSSEYPEYVAKNVESWTRSNAEYTDQSAARAWAQDEITYGIWHIPESELHVLPDLPGLDVVELGCGTAFFSAWLAKRGARPVGVDLPPVRPRDRRDAAIPRDPPTLRYPGERLHHGLQVLFIGRAFAREPG